MPTEWHNVQSKEALIRKQAGIKDERRRGKEKQSKCYRRVTPCAYRHTHTHKYIKTYNTKESWRQFSHFRIISHGLPNFFIFLIAWTLNMCGLRSFHLFYSLAGPHLCREFVHINLGAHSCLRGPQDTCSLYNASLYCWNFPTHVHTQASCH